MTAPAARVTNEFDIALQAVAVRLNGTPLSVLRSYSGTVEAQYETTYVPTSRQPTPTCRCSQPSTRGQSRRCRPTPAEA